MKIAMVGQTGRNLKSRINQNFKTWKNMKSDSFLSTITQICYPNEQTIQYSECLDEKSGLGKVSIYLEFLGQVIKCRRPDCSSPVANLLVKMS